MDVGIEKQNVKSAAGSKQAIVFVHGFTGDRKRTWGRIPEFLSAEPRLAGWEMFFFGYPSRWRFDILGLWSADPAIEEIATRLLSAPELAPYTDLAWVAHSMGGLVVQRALIKSPPLLKRSRDVIFFGTPSAGLAKASMFARLKQQIANMQEGGEFIKKLRGDWSELHLDTKPPFRFLTVAGLEDQFVPPNSSLGPFPEPFQASIDGNHVTMLKAESASALAVRQIIGVLTVGASLGGARTAARLAEECGQFQKVIDELWLNRKELDDTGATTLALALDTEGRREDAIQFLEQHSRKGTDILGVLAGRYKRSWLGKRLRPHFERALQLYNQGYAEAIAKDPVDHDQAYYHGINVAFLELAGENGNRERARHLAAEVLEHCRQAQNPKLTLWRLATEGDALIILGRTKEALQKHTEASRCQMDPWQALSIQEQSIRTADLAGLQEAEIQNLSDFYQGCVV